MRWTELQGIEQQLTSLAPLSFDLALLHPLLVHCPLSSYAHPPAPRPSPPSLHTQPMTSCTRSSHAAHILLHTTTASSTRSSYTAPDPPTRSPYPVPYHPTYTLTTLCAVLTQDTVCLHPPTLPTQPLGLVSAEYTFPTHYVVASFGIPPRPSCAVPTRCAALMPGMGCCRRP
eukprot:696885-Rhodomonas_salina.1